MFTVFQKHIHPMILCSIAFFLFAFLLLLVPASLSAQHDYDVWFFGYGVGLDFRQSPPLLSAGGNSGNPVMTYEGSAGICDRLTGEVLFSTDGSTVYNRANKVMPDGAGL